MSLDVLSDTPIVPHPMPDAVREYLEYLDSLIDTDEVGYAIDTLRAIRTTIAERQRVSDGQRQAIHNIVAGAAEGQRRRETHTTSRRYEGFRR